MALTEQQAKEEVLAYLRERLRLLGEDLKRQSKSIDDIEAAARRFEVLQCEPYKDGFKVRVLSSDPSGEEHAMDFIIDQHREVEAL